MENVHFNYRYSLQLLDKKIPDDLSGYPLYPVEDDIFNVKMEDIYVSPKVNSAKNNGDKSSKFNI